MALGRREQEITDFLHERVFDPVLASSTAPERLKQGIRLTITRMKQRNADGMIHYFWSAVVGTERSTRFAREMRAAGFLRFEEAVEEFRAKFDKPRVIRPSK